MGQSLRTYLLVPADHAAHAAPRLWRDCSTEAEADREARSQPHCGPRQKRTVSGIPTSQTRATTTALEPTTSTLGARMGRVVLVKQPADQAQHVEWRARKKHVAQRAEETQWVSTWM